STAFAAAEVTFTARNDEKGGGCPVRGPPFTRSVLIPLGDPEDSESSARSTGLAGEFLSRELPSPLGRTADPARTALEASAGLSGRLSCQSLGLYRFTWPRRALLQRVGRNLCERLGQRWVSKGPAPTRETGQALGG